MEKTTKKTTVWETLSSINCNEKTEKKENLTYLSWAWAWGILRENYPTASYKVREWDNKPYLFDKNLGYLVETSVTIEGETLSMRLPVMDSKNKAMKSEPYEFVTRSGKKTVAAADMFDINTAIMRCLTKNLALFGLGFYIYAGEDIPQAEAEAKDDEVLQVVKMIDNLDNLNLYWKDLGAKQRASKRILEAFKAQKIEIQQNNVQ